MIGYRTYDTGNLRTFNTLAKAVVDAKVHLRHWANPEDRVRSFFCDGLEDSDEHREVIVCTEFGEPTDASVLVRPVRFDEV